MEIVTVADYWEEILKSRGAPFVGLIFRVPPRLWRDFSGIQAELKKIDPRQLYSKPSTFHITVKGLGFLGERLDEEKLEKILMHMREVVSEFPPFEINFRGLGAFPTSVYVKVEDPGDQLRMMNKRIAQEFGADIDSSEYDGDAYVPHVTLATFATKDVGDLLRKVDEKRDADLGMCAVFEIEAVEANMMLALGPEEAQDGAFAYIRSFPLGG